ncbi:hypothetical protein ACQ4LE_009699 [Meloidogyne hapla]|uniref:Fukutin n=1 Tax=Meloidogyne hapla TaxID=6305 RepID=A0A1I8B0T6_MELHA
MRLKYIFIIPLFILSFIIFFINYRYYYYYNQVKEEKINYETLIRPLIVDFNCLENQKNGKNCTYPIFVAIPDGHPQQSNEFIEIKFILDISENNRDFWLFKEVNNPTNLIATREFKRSKSNIENIEMPSDLKSFKRDWKNGKYLKCTPLLERPKFIQRTIPLKFLDKLVEFSNLLDKFNATAFLLSGTLLGWARECSLIPHTTDIDLGIFSEEHSDSLLRAMITSKIFKIYWILGRLKNSFELSVSVDGTKIDLFYLYKSKENASIGGMRPSLKQRLKWNFPKLSGEICAAEMHGRLFHVLCDYYKIVESDYGKEEWKKDYHSKDYVWDKSSKNIEYMEIYLETEWPNVYLYIKNKSDRFNSKKVDKWIKNIKKTL